MKPPEVSLPSRALFAFNTNLDSVKHISGRFIEEIAYDIPDEMWELRLIMRRGAQKEIRISDTTACWLEQVVGSDYFLMGGQAGNAANAASSLGVTSLVHTNYKSRALLSRFDSSSRVLIAQGDSFRPASCFAEKKPQATHYILEFEKGDVFYKKPIPHSNRFIASFDPQELQVDPDFSRAIRSEIKSISKAFIGGFHLLREPESLAQFIREIESWKKQNPELKIHFESGEYINKDVMREAVSELFPLIDSIGMNKSEFKSFGLSLSSLSRKVPEIIVHEPRSIILKPDNKARRLAVRFGQLAASFRAKTGKLPSFKEIDDYAKTKGSLFTAKPKSTVGLGDTFASAYFMAR